MRRLLWTACLVLFGAAPAWGQSTATGPVAPATPDPILPCDLGACDESAPGWQARLTADYLLWWVRRGPTPPLVTTGPVVTGDPLTSSGPVGRNGTVVLFGDSGLRYDAISGGRWGLDGWLPSAGVGAQVSGFVLERRSAGFGATSDANGFPILARPFYDVLDNQSSAVLVSYPGALSGNVAVVSHSRLWGVEGNLTGLAVGGEGRRVCLLAGVRYLDLLESLGLTHSSTVLPAGAAFLNGFQLNPGDTLRLDDSFRTRNQFYGGQVGAEGEWEVGRLVLGGTAKVALGSVRQGVTVQGNSLLFAAGVPGISDSAAGGAFALDTNSGQSHRDRFAVVPEVSLRVGYRLTSSLTASLGYTFLYVSTVARPGSQIDPGINVGHAPSSEAFGLFPDPRRPAPLVNHSDFWAQGFSLGLELRF